MEETSRYSVDYPAPTGKDGLIKRIEYVFSEEWIDLARSGPTGPGKTWEDHLGISENNLRLPDVGNIEIKVLEEKKSSALTLVSRALPYEELLSYGITKTDVIGHGLFKTRRDRKTGELIQLGKIYYQVNKNAGTVDWYLKSSSVRHEEHALLDRWTIGELFAKTSWLCVTFYRKRAGDIICGQMLPTMCYLFHLPETILLEMLAKGQVYYELRAHIRKDGSVRDHGAAWRMTRRTLTEFLRNMKPLVAAKNNYQGA